MVTFLLSARASWVTGSNSRRGRRAALPERPPVQLMSAVVATMQLSYLPGLARRGAWRAQIEAVRCIRTTAAAASAKP